MLKIPNLVKFGKFHQCGSIWYTWDSAVDTNEIDAVPLCVDKV